MLKTKSKYYFTRLDNASKRVYTSILSAWESRNREPSFIMNPLASNVDIQQIIQFIAWDNPGLFYVDFSRVVVTGTPLSMTVHSDFLFSERQIDEAETQLRQSITAILSSPLLSNIDKMDKYQKELALHDIIIKKISYEHGGINSSSTSIVGGLLFNKAVCEGYAKTFKLLCDQIGLSCILVAGTATPQNRPQENHAWNIVKLSGVCAHIDVTWDSTMRIGDEPCYDHFNITDDDISQDHAWDKTLLPRCISAENNYFTRSNSLVQNDADIKDYIKSQLKIGQKNITLKFSDKGLSQSQVEKKVSDVLSQNSLLSKGSYGSYSLRYNPVRRIVSVMLT